MPIPESDSMLLVICVKSAEQLKVVQMIGSQDPYVKIWAGRGGEKVRTKVHKGGGRMATWNELFVFNIKGIDHDNHLVMEIKNKNLTSSTSIGVGEIRLGSFGSTPKDGWYSIYDSKGQEAGKILVEGYIERGNPNRALGGELGRSHFRTLTSGKGEDYASTESSNDIDTDTDTRRPYPTQCGLPLVRCRIHYGGLCVRSLDVYLHVWFVSMLANLGSLGSSLFKVLS
ncbi:unnamed protein product [Choristocarpus tenellus]